MEGENERRQHRCRRAAEGLQRLCRGAAHLVRWATTDAAGEMQKAECGMKKAAGASPCGQAA